jgi:aldehyde dehydrogenase (NAD+)
MTQPPDLDLFFDPTRCFIGGEWLVPNGQQTLPLENPSTGETIGAIARGMAHDVDLAVLAAQRALDTEWGRTPAAERGRILTRIGQAVLARADELAKIEAIDVGKPLKQARADALALARYMEFYGGACDKVHGETIPYQEGYTVYTLRQPHGVTAHIIPWNYPMQIIGRSVGGALAMGNAAVLKPAEEACLTAIASSRPKRPASPPSPSRKSARRPGSPRERSTSSPASAKRRARRSPHTQASTTFPLPARSASAS